MNQPQEFWNYFEENGYYESVNNGDELNAFGSGRKYFNDEEYVQFNHGLDNALGEIGIINKELYAIKLDDLTLTDNLREEFKLRVKRLRG